LAALPFRAAPLTPNPCGFSSFTCSSTILVLAHLTPTLTPTSSNRVASYICRLAELVASPVSYCEGFLYSAHLHRTPRGPRGVLCSRQATDQRMPRSPAKEREADRAQFSPLATTLAFSIHLGAAVPARRNRSDPRALISHR